MTVDEQQVDVLFPSVEVEVPVWQSWTLDSDSETISDQVLEHTTGIEAAYSDAWEEQSHFPDQVDSFNPVRDIVIDAIPVDRHQIPDLILTARDDTGTDPDVRVTPDGYYAINHQLTHIPYNGQPEPYLFLSPAGHYVLNYVDTGILAPSLSQVAVQEVPSVDDQRDAVEAPFDSVASVENSIVTQDQLELPDETENQNFVVSTDQEVQEDHYSTNHLQSPSEDTVIKTEILNMVQEIILNEHHQAMAEQAQREMENLLAAEAMSSDLDQQADTYIPDVPSQSESPNDQLPAKEVAQEVSVVAQQSVSAETSVSTANSYQPISQDINFLPIKAFTALATSSKGISKSQRANTSSHSKKSSPEPVFIPNQMIAQLGMGKGVSLVNGPKI